MLKQVRVWALGAVVLLASTGCGVELAVMGAAASAASSAASAGSAVYARGKLEAAWLGHFDLVVGAAEEACGDMGFYMVSSQGDLGKGVWKMVAVDDQGDKISVRVTRQTAKLTEFQINVGLWGKQSTARLYLKRMVEAIDLGIEASDGGGVATVTVQASFQEPLTGGEGPATQDSPEGFVPQDKETTE